MYSTRLKTIYRLELVYRSCKGRRLITDFFNGCMVFTIFGSRYLAENKTGNSVCIMRIHTFTVIEKIHYEETLKKYLKDRFQINNKQKFKTCSKSKFQTFETTVITDFHFFWNITLNVQTHRNKYKHVY